MSNTEIKLAYGDYMSEFMDAEQSMTSAVFAGFYNHFAPPLFTMVVPPQVVGDAVKAVMAKASASVKGQVISFSVPTGFVADVVTEVEAAAPGFIAKAHAMIDKEITSALVAVGVLPKP